MDSNLRTASLADLSAIMDLERAGFPAGIVEEEAVFAHRLRWFPEGFLVAGSPPWGYLCAEIWSGADSTDPRRFDLGHDLCDYLDRQGDTLYIASMTVHPTARGGGRGRALFGESLAHLHRAFPRLKQAVLIVNEHWRGARSIYAAEGFVETGRLPEFFRPEDGPVGAALVMERRLTPA